MLIIYYTSDIGHCMIGFFCGIEFTTTMLYHDHIHVASIIIISALLFSF